MEKDPEVALNGHGLLVSAALQLSTLTSFKVLMGFSTTPQGHLKRGEDVSPEAQEEEPYSLICKKALSPARVYQLLGSGQLSTETRPMAPWVVTVGKLISYAPALRLLSL